MLASDIKGYCTADACWRFMHDVASRMAECHAEGRYCRLLRLHDVVIDDDAFRISDDTLCDQGSAESDVWMLAAAAFELILGTPVFNGLGEKCQKSGTPVPNLPDKEMTALNDLLRSCLQKDASKRPDMNEVKSVASDELQKCMSRHRAQRICPVNACSVPDGEYDRKWPEAMTVVKKMIICVLLVVIGTVPSFSQSLPYLQDDAYLMELMEVSKMLRSRNESIWEEAQSRMSKMLEVFTMMDELRDAGNDCALVGNSVTSFGLNRMISMLKRTNTVMQNTGKGLLDGTDLRYHYSIYEKGVRKGSTATYDGLSGRTGRQVFVIIPYSADQPYETELSLSDGKKYHPVHKDKDGISYYVIDAEEGPGDDDVLTLKVRNNDMQNNRSFVIINHNYRNK